LRTKLQAKISLLVTFSRTGVTTNIFAKRTSARSARLRLENGNGSAALASKLGTMTAASIRKDMINLISFGTRTSRAGDVLKMTGRAGRTAVVIPSKSQ